MFKGIYYKHQKDGNTVCLIEGEASDGHFLQVLTNTAVYQFDHDKNCRFGLNGIEIDLPNIQGKIEYSGLTPLRNDIMGPFRFLPMQCRHSVYSMQHSLHGSLKIEDQIFNFDGGKGYMEGDSGNSFPQKYFWLHSNDFSQPCSIMISIAKIPFLGFKFWGCLCAIVYKGKEYRLATYQGVEIIEAKQNGIILSQGALRFEVKVKPGKVFPLRAPQKGEMSGTIYQSNDAMARFRLFDHKKLIFELQSTHVSLENNL